MLRYVSDLFTLIDWFNLSINIIQTIINGLNIAVKLYNLLNPLNNADILLRANVIGQHKVVAITFVSYSAIFNVPFLDSYNRELLYYRSCYRKEVLRPRFSEHIAVGEFAIRPKKCKFRGDLFCFILKWCNRHAFCCSRITAGIQLVCILPFTLIFIRFVNYYTLFLFLSFCSFLSDIDLL